MKILLVPCRFLPDSVGGTEVYVHGLAKCLRALGVDVQIALTQEENGPAAPYTYDGFSVRTLPGAQGSAGPALKETIEAIQPDVAHFHPLYLAAMLPLMGATRELDIPTVCTYHTATVTCGRGDMLLWGQEPCNGRIDVRRCSVCVAHQKGLPRFAARLVPAPGRDGSPALVALPRKLASMLSIPSQRAAHLAHWQRAIQCIDHWVAVCEWVRSVLLTNGIEQDRVTLSRHGLARPPGHRTTGRQEQTRKHGPGQSVHLGYLGRIDPHKGLHILIEATRHLSNRQFKLYIAGRTKRGCEGYERRLRGKTAGNPSVEWIGPVKPQEAGLFLSHLDALVVPSICVETGPMTVLEAWAVGTPVIGSDRGGLHELLGDGKGWVFPAGDRRSLCRTLARFAKEVLNERYVPPMGNVRTAGDVAREMKRLYESLLSVVASPGTPAQVCRQP